MKKQRILSFLLALVMTVSLLPGTALAAKTEDFTDVSKSDWFYKYVDFVTDNKYFVGTSETTFSPEMPMTRAMFVVVLAALEGAKVDNNVAPFADVPAGTWYSGAVKWAADNGVVAGVGGNKFAPDTAISREQMAVMMNAYVDWHSEKHGEDHREKAKVEDFGDAAKIASWAANAVENCRNWGLIAGAPDGNFYPQNTATRAEVATVIYNLAWLVYGGSSGPSNTTKLYFYLNDGTNAQVENSPFTVSKNSTYTISFADPTREGYTFKGWDTEKDDDGVDSDNVFTGGSIQIGTSYVNMYAQWEQVEEFVPEDLIYNALKNIETAVKDKAQEKLNAAQDAVIEKLDGTKVPEVITDAIGSIEFADKNGDGQFSYGVENGGSYVIVSGVTVGEPNEVDTDTHETIAVEAQIEADSETIIYIAETAVTKSIELMGLAAENAPTKEEIQQIVDELVAELKNKVAGIDITKADAKEIAEAVYAKVEAKALAGLNYTKELWVANFKQGENYITDDITITCGDVDVVITVDDAKGAYYQGSKKDAIVDLATAMAKDLYADLKACSEYTALDEIVLAAEATVTFKGNEAAEEIIAHTDRFPYVYPVTASLKITGSAADNFEYKYENGHFVKVLVTEAVKAEYEELGEKTTTEILANEKVQAYLEKYLNEEKLQEQVQDSAMIESLTHALESTGMKDAETVVNGAVNQWIKENASSESLAESGLLEYFWNGTTDGNTAIYALIDAAGNAAVSVLEQKGFAAGGRMALAMGTEDLKGLLIANVPAEYEKLEELGLDEYFVAYVTDEMHVLEENPDIAPCVTDEITENMNSVVDEMIYSAAVDAMETMVDNQGGNVKAYLEQAMKLKSIDTLKDIELGELAAILDTEAAKNLYANGKDVVIGRLTDLVRFIPDEASVIVAGKTITEETLAGIRDAETVGETCKAAAKLLSNLKGLSLSDFDGEGQKITVKYDGANNKLAYTFGLVIDFQ